ncbi:MAG: molybdenum cofactor guanylyltransferase [Alphaproteobacteria bacterium]|nr:molybdenum cofactor guanylyltransferase [Alphaproteobacteria bacterium]
MTIGALILAGGKSSRFGAPKALADLFGRPVIAHVAQRLGVSPLAVAGPEDMAVAAGADARLQDPPFATPGPLAGLAAGLAWARMHNVAWLAVAPCDTPLLPVDVAQTLYAAAKNRRAAFARHPAGDEPLCAIYRIDAEPVVAAAARAQDHPPMHAVLRTLDAAPAWFPDARAFLNVNTRADLDAAREG